MRRGNLSTRPERGTISSRSGLMLPEIEVVEGNALSFSSDALVMKYAQEFYGVDSAASQALESVCPLTRMKPKAGSITVVDTKGVLGAKTALFVGVVPLQQFGYGQIRSFASLGLQSLRDLVPDAQYVSFTTHGAGYGLDEREAFLALYAGLLDAARHGSAPPLKRITIVELNPGRALRLGRVITDMSRSSSRHKIAPGTAGDTFAAGAESSNKPHVFVAMPFSEGKMEDVFGFGIQVPVHDAGFLCERVDMSSYTGEVLSRVRKRIETASLVIADLSGANPNVYLEVGYAWGRERPTLLVAEEGSELKFDVRGHRCLMYRNITDLSKKLRKDLSQLLSR